MKIFNHNYLIIIFLLIFSIYKTQVKITLKSSDVNSKPHRSAILEISDDRTGVLFPRVGLLNDKDKVTVPTPVPGLVLYNTTIRKMNFWENSKWNKNFEIEDAQPYISSIFNYSSSSATPTVITGFPNYMQLFTMGTGPAGWTDLKVNVPITPKKLNNTIFISGEGMVQLNNPNYPNSFQFAIAIFVDNQLKIVRKYKFEDITACPWKKFEISGQFSDLSPNVSHNIKMYGYNLPLIYTGYGPEYGSSLTYGGNSNGCGNLNQDMAKIFLTAQLTE